MAQTKDPVCGMNVNPGGIQAKYEDEIYYFCSDECRGKFQNNPSQFAPETRR